MKYCWDRKLLRKLYHNHIVRKEIKELYISLWDIFNLFQTPHYTKNQTVATCYTFFKSFDFTTKYFHAAAEFPELSFAEHQYQNQISYDDAFLLAHDFYKTTSPDIFNAFLRFYNERSTHCKFYSPIKGAFYSGNTYISQTADEVFISVNRQKNINLGVLITHEYAHAINHFLYPENAFVEAKAPFDEITSIFMELLFFDYISKISQLEANINYERQKFYITLLNDFEYLDTQYCIAESFKEVFENPEVDDITFHTLFKNIRNDLGLSSKELKEALVNPPYCIMPYALGGIIALELYHIFQTDPDKAFYLLDQIQELQGETPNEIDSKINELGICPTQHIETFTRKLKL